jgi:predicted Zn-dependent protease
MVDTPEPAADGTVLLAEADVVVAAPADITENDGLDAATLAELLAAARAARQSGDPDEALRNWAAARARVPSDPAAFRHAAHLLLELGRGEEAVAILEEGRVEYAADLSIATDHAWTQHRRRQWEDALKSWAHLRAAFPDQAIGYVGAAVTLRDTHRYDEAEAILREAGTNFPDNVAVLRERGWVAQARRNWPEAEQRWAILRERFPEDVTGYVLGAAALREQDRPNEAEALLHDTIERFPDNAWAASEHAWLAHRRKDWPEAIARWQQVRSHFPNQCVWGGAAALRESGDLDAAEDWLADLLPRHPREFRALMEFAEIAQQRGNLEEARSRWSTLRTRFPDDPTGYAQEAAALRALGRHQDADALLTQGMTRLPNDTSLLLKYAQAAVEMQDWREAARRWALVRASSAAHLGYMPAATALRNAGLPDEAESLLTEGIQRFPADPGLLIELAWAAHHRKDWVVAAERWETVRARFPQFAVAWSAGATALRHAGLPDEADRIVRDGIARHAEPGLLVEYAQNAVYQRNWPEAVLRWEQYREQHPDDMLGYVRGAQALREAGRLDDAAALLQLIIDKQPEDSTPLIERAWLAHLVRDWPEALRRWTVVRETFPQLPIGYENSLVALTDMRRFDEAEEVAAAALERFADNRELLRASAFLAFHRHQWQEAEQRFTALRERFPDYEFGYLGGAGVLRRLEKFAEAEAVLAEGIARIPQSPAIRLEHALIPLAWVDTARRNWPEAFQRFAAIRDAFPEFEQGYTTGARYLKEAGKSDEAEAVLLEGRQRLPTSLFIAREWAFLPMGGPDPQEAVRRCRELLQNFPTDPEAHAGLAQALMGTEQFDEAEKLLGDAAATFPKTSRIAAEYARLAGRRGDLAEAVTRWRDAAQRFPFDGAIREQLHLAETRLAETDSGALLASRPATQSDIDPNDLSQLALQFVSLGGHPAGCEFGLFQRDVGIEPLDLFRWTGTEPEKLIAAIEQELVGVGDPEFTELGVGAPQSQFEYITTDTRFSMVMHTFIKSADVPRERMFRQACTRLRFLRQKFLQDLAEATKIFVYRTVPGNLDDDVLKRLSAAMRRYGSNTLLYARPADDAHPPGQVELLQPGLMIGYIDRFTLSEAGEQLGANTESWAAICRNAYALWKTTA